LNTTLQPGQLNVTQDTYNSVVLQQVRELWTNYGALDEIWFDGGLVISKIKSSIFIISYYFCIPIVIHKV
jgi:hypothetical protein